MYRCVTNIIITQQATADYPKRNQVLNFDFVTSFESSDSWKDLTNKGRMVLPKNLFYVDQHGKKVWLKDTNITLGGFGNTPLIMRGDRIIINAGYKYFDKSGKEITDTATMFTGFVTKVSAKIPIELELEDNMWKLKQTPVGTKTFTESNTLEDILDFILTGTDFTYRAMTKTSFGSFRVGSETAAQVLQRLQKTYGFQSYFRGNELRSGVLIYIAEEALQQNFVFQQNIIEDELEYNRRDDIVLSAVAHNTITEETGEFCKDGTAKTKRTRLTVLVTIKNPTVSQPYIYKVIQKGDYVPENEEGERRTLFFPGAKTYEALATMAYNELKRYYYTGLKGTFTTFGIPFVKQGDNALIKDKIFPERNGIYKIKAVDYSGGVNGLRQKVHLDYRVDLLENANNE